jgi:phenylpyruvate tautomerase PptA (4-oxalocrotonate tautomerase family)
MPLYQCLVPAGSLDADTRAALAQAITNAHFSATSTAPGFIDVVFTEYEPTAYLRAGRPNPVSVISGEIRPEHDRETRGELLRLLCESWSAITGQEKRQILVSVKEVDPTSVMEAGLILPSPGEEATWMRQHSRELAELQSGHD